MFQEFDDTFGLSRYILQNSGAGSLLFFYKERIPAALLLLPACLTTKCSLPNFCLAPEALHAYATLLFHACCPCSAYIYVMLQLVEELSQRTKCSLQSTSVSCIINIDQACVIVIVIVIYKQFIHLCVLIFSIVIISIYYLHIITSFDSYQDYIITSPKNSTTKSSSTKPPCLLHTTPSP